MDTAPIVLFVYNRLEHTRQTVESLALNTLASQSLLFIYSDGVRNPNSAPKVEMVRQYLRQITGFKEIKIIERQTNMGLAASVISGVSEVIQRYGAAIVVEDDLKLSVNFLQFMNDCLRCYKNDAQIFSISGYCAPIEIPANYTSDVFLFRRINSWGWATWSDRWQKTDWEVNDFQDFILHSKARKEFNKGGEESSIVLLWQMQNKINSWAIRFYYACFKLQMQNIYPVVSKVLNIGADGTGSHVEKTKKYDTQLDDGSKTYTLDKNLKINEIIEQNYRKHFGKRIHRKIINWILLSKYIIKLKISKIF